ncbi:disintegrin and metalloproteinase domain-containing protein 28-like [Sycon ciliatum]|uniref:disintegrin and metalloproteinase domain-containing protein 28-like n=1 Tax=Sycon ciliatum TaxID=27933 RepID=UPI0031F64504
MAMYTDNSLKSLPGRCPRRLLPVIVLLVTLTAVQSSHSVDYDQELASGHERLQQLAHRYETVHVDTAHHLHGVRKRRATQGDDTYSHPPSTNFDIQAFGQTFRLQLELNTMLLPVGTQVRYYKENGELVVDHDAVNCYYQGETDGFSHGASHAVINTCNGISGSFGVGPAGHWTMERTFFIEPLTKEPTPNGTHLHAVYKAGDSKEKHHFGSCGVSTNKSQDHASPLNLAQGILNVDKDTVHIHQRTKRQASSSVTRYVELLLVLDATLFRSTRVNKDMTVATNRARSVANFVDSIYRKLNIRVPLVAVEVFNRRDLFATSSNFSRTLHNFKLFRNKNLVGRIHHDNAQLMTGHNFIGDTVGYASVSGMCSTRSVGVNQDTASAFSMVAGTMAHEMGHNLGMKHDNRGCDCTATFQKGGCIMAGMGSPYAAPQTWSSCSRSDLSTFLSHGAGHCLSNQPTTLFGDPVCGNGFVEGTEQCDCGTAAQCTTTCCNPATCRFTTGSQCSDGPCCQNCHYRTPGTLCRSAVNSCDVAETCSGRTHTCPNDIFKQNGQTCDSDSSFCYDGQCNTQDAQCKEIWGTSGVVAHQSCYDLNTKGTNVGNCGSTGKTHKGCKLPDIRCGRLQCEGGNKLPDMHGIRYFTQPLYVIEKGRWKITNCKTITIMQTSDAVEQSMLAVDGSPCGSSSLCVSSRCRSISSLGITPCPSSRGRVCAGNGVCTTLNSCLCNRGWTGADCSRATSGAVNGRWGPWTVWSGCSQSCGTRGVRTRTRDCDNPPPSNGGTVCRGATSDRETCNRVQCATPVNGNWAKWSAWSRCSATCGAGTRSRQRTCNNPSPSNGGSRCPGTGTTRERCETQACPVDGGWSPWTVRTQCSQTCGTGGVKTLTRTCNNPTPSNGGKPCHGIPSNRQPCNRVPCPTAPAVNGNWAKWSAWSRCSATCGAGTRSRQRTCNNPSPSNGGSRCPGTGTTRERCETQACPVDGGWSPWTVRTQCSQTCGTGGVKTLTRTCNNPTPSNGGKPCHGIPSNRQPCNRVPCPTAPAVNGNWSDWALSECSHTCGGGTHVLERTCSNPEPSNGGKTCRTDGVSVESWQLPCNTYSCAN